MSKVSQLYPQPEFVFVLDNNATMRFAIKKFPKSKVIFIRSDADYYESFMTHLPELQDFYESLIDERSRETFCGYWLGRISNQFAHFVHTYESHHLMGGFIPPRGGTVIEAGAYDGGTATIFTELGYKVYTFEMDKINFAATEPVAAEKNFVLENFGLGAYKHTEHYNPTGKNWTKLGGGEDTPEDVPRDFSDKMIKFLTSLGLEPDDRKHVECVLFAR
ncbi:MAG: hypothetical protein SR2Q5_04715 [Quinella sp. 2Q5]|nr:hypothetical protein [Quinella sp. 2Q5]